MAEANTQHEGTKDKKDKAEKHQKSDIPAGNGEKTKGYQNLSTRTKFIGKHLAYNTEKIDNEAGNTETGRNEKQCTSDIPTERPYVYRNFSSVTLKPLVLRNHSWSTKDIKERFLYTAKRTEVGQENIGSDSSNHHAVGENVFKRQNIYTASARNSRINPNHDAPLVKYSTQIQSNRTRIDAADDNIGEKCSNKVKVDNSDENPEAGMSIDSYNKDAVVKPEYFTKSIEPNVFQTADKSDASEANTGICQFNHKAEEENSNENKKAIDILVGSPTINYSKDEEQTEVTDQNAGACQGLHNATEEISNEFHEIIDNPTENTTANGNNDTVREIPEDDHGNIEAEENREESEENHADLGESLNRDENNDTDESGPISQAGQQNKGNDEDTKADDTTENSTQKEPWTQDEIQALLRKAINLHAPEKDLKTIIGCGGDVNRPIKSGLHPLHYAAYTDYPECIELLLNSGANVNVTDDIGYTPLHLAARRGNHRSMMVLLENGAMINYSEPGVEIHQSDERNKLGFTTMEPINLAVQNGYPKCARLLLEKGARPNNKYFMGYEICLAPLDNPECLELLLEFGADPNVFNRCGLSPLMKASKDHHIEAVRKLIKYGADVNAVCPPLFEQKSVLQFAIISGNIVIINILLGKGAKIARHGECKYSALHMAVTKGRADICRLLLQHGADANERSEEGATPLMLACATPDLMERREIVQLLLDCGADINAHSPGYCYFDPYLAPLTEYFKCIENREGFSIVRLLIRNGAIIHFSSSGLDMELKRLRDPFSIVPYVHCLQNNQQMFDFVVSAATKYNPLLIYANRNIPEEMKDSLLYTATRPRELKHLVRVSLRSQLTPRLPDKVQQLPLPPLLKSYLLFKLM